MEKDTLYDWCVEQHRILREENDGYRSGRWQIGEVIDGKMVDQTESCIVENERRIEELEKIIARYHE